MKRFLVYAVLLASIALNLYFLYFMLGYPCVDKFSPLLTYNVNGMLNRLNTAESRLLEGQKSGWSDKACLWQAYAAIDSAAQYGWEANIIAPLLGNKADQDFRSSRIDDLCPLLMQFESIIIAQAEKAEKGQPVNTDQLNDLLDSIKKADFPVRISSSDGWRLLGSSVEKLLSHK
ncbi:MAG: hypothetical protein PWP44_1648 [Thermacetogenium sp.]|jgi:hypothetical protein|nr:hypothetical protein [Thermacetogenium sp.]